MLRSVLVIGQDFAESLLRSSRWKWLGEEVVVSRTPTEAFEVLARGRSFDLVLISQHDRGPDIVPLLRRLSRFREIPLVVVSENPRISDAIKFVRAGALDYVQSPLDDETFEQLIQKLEKSCSFGDRRHFFCDECPPDVEIVGHSPAIKQCLTTIKLVAQSKCDPVLVLGETGAGKELTARAVHVRRHGDFERFVAVNCATLGANLLESELFGHVKGAFTGAVADKVGLFEQAAGGSIFLDEITEMSPELQSKLLRAIQEKTFRRVGGTNEISCKADIIASSNKIPVDAIKKGQLREDLYYRLAIYPIITPSLSHETRREDIPLLGEYFLGVSKSVPEGGPRRLTKEAEHKLMQHHWPGNVRELRNVMERAIILERSESITAHNLVFDHQVAQFQPPQDTAESSDGLGTGFSLEAAERELISRALKETAGRRTQAAALLGITRTTLHAKLKRYNIHSPSTLGRPASPTTASLSE